MLIVPRKTGLQTTMRALTIIEPWCSALAYHGKDVENRTWAPNNSQLDTVVLLHAGKNQEDWRAFADFDEYEPWHEPLVRMAQTFKNPPLASLPLATARLVGYLYAPGEMDRCVAGYEYDALAGLRSPWAMKDQCQHVFAERTPLPEEWLQPEFKMRGMLGYWTVDQDLARRLLAFHAQHNPR